MAFQIPTDYIQISGKGIMPTLPSVRFTYSEGVLKTDLFLNKWAYNVDDRKWFFNNNGVITPFYNSQFKKGIEFFDLWNSGTAYAKNAYVVYLGNIYLSKAVSGIGVLPTNTGIWINKGDYINIDGNSDFNSLTPCKFMNQSAPFSYEMPENSCLYFIHFRKVSGNPTVKIGLTNGGEELMASELMSGVMTGQTFFFPYDLATILYIGISGGTVNVNITYNSDHL